jgi:uncharacterized membrane protein
MGPVLAPGEDELVPRRPRDASALIGSAFRLYRRYPALFFVLASGVIVPFQLIVLAATGAGPYFQGDSSFTLQAFLSLAQWILIIPLISALHVHAVADVREGSEPELRSVAMRGFRVLPVVVAAAIMSSLGIVLGFVALIVPGIILIFRWYVVAQVAAIDHEGWLPALRGSRVLTAGNYGHIFVFGLLVALIEVVPDTIVSAGVGSHDTSAAAFLVGLVVSLFVASFTALATALLYFDLRARKETSAAG